MRELEAETVPTGLEEPALKRSDESKCDRQARKEWNWRDSHEAEAHEVAKEMATARERYVRYLSQHGDKPLMEYREEERRWVVENEERVRAEAEDRPAEQFSWHDLNNLSEIDPEAGRDLWVRLRMEAREELESGWRAGSVLEADGMKSSPYDRARFLALRQSLREEWMPRGGTEAALVDMLAQIQSTYEQWLGRHVHRLAYGGVEVTRDEKDYRRERGEYVTARVTEHEELEQTAAMADRWQRAYLRTVRALRDLRRHAPVVIQNAGQVNIGEQQVNVAHEIR